MFFFLNYIKLLPYMVNDVLNLSNENHSIKYIYSYIQEIYNYV